MMTSLHFARLSPFSRRCSTAAFLGPREVAKRETEVLQALEGVSNDAFLGGSSVAVRQVAVNPATRDVSFKVVLPNLAIPIKGELQSACEERGVHACG